MADEKAIFQKIQDLLEIGRKIEAIKLYRECYPDHERETGD